MIGRMGAKLLYHSLMWLYNTGTGKHPKFIKFVKLDCYVLLILFITDIHRFGAWYTGNAAYWMSWAYITIPIMLIPLILFGLAILTVWIARTNRYRMIGIGLSCFVCWLVGLFAYSDVYLAKKFPDPGYFIGGIIRSDPQFWITFIICFILFFVLPFCVYYFFVKQEPEDNI